MLLCHLALALFPRFVFLFITYSPFKPTNFDEYLSKQGYRAQKGQIVDASIIKVPIQHNTRDEKKQIKNVEQAKWWNENKQRQKDTDDSLKLPGIIQLDDAYWGDKKHDGKRGRGATGKTPFLAAVSTNLKGHPIYMRLSRIKSFSITDKVFIISVILISAASSAILRYFGHQEISWS